MVNIAATAANTLRSSLTAASGADIQLNTLARSIGDVAPIPLSSIVAGNSPAELLELSQPIKYPTVNIYCEKLQNTLQEKFRTFSGLARMCVEIRHSQDKTQSVQQGLEIYATAVCTLLDSSRGDWGSGLFYSGGYEVQFTPLKRGGRSFIQTAKIFLDLAVSI